MQAYKLKGKVDSDGNLIIPQPTNIAPGEVEVIILQPSNDNFTDSEYYQLVEQGLKEVYDEEPEGLWEQCLES